MEFGSSHPVHRLFGVLTQPRRRAALPEELSALHGATRVSVDYKGQEIAVWKWGKGPRILLVHGWESRAAHLVGFVPGFVKQGYEVIALDGPAHGDSEGDNTDVVDFGCALVAVAKEEGPFASVVAHSVGSAAALYAFAHGVKTQSSIHLCGPASLTRVLRRGAEAMGLDDASAGYLEKMMSDRIGAALDIMDLSNLLDGMKHPALILHDPNDQEVPVSESHDLAKNWPGSAILMIKDVGHRKILKDPYVISTVTDFVTQTIGGAQ